MTDNSTPINFYEYLASQTVEERKALTNALKEQGYKPNEITNWFSKIQPIPEKHQPVIAELVNKPVYFPKMKSKRILVEVTE